MDLFGLGGIVSGIGDSIIGGLNYKNQEEALEFNKNAFREQMDFAKYQYEDQKQLANTAVQRKAKDLEAAGFNKLMAAGGEAGTGGTVAAAGANVQAPQLNISTGEMLDRVYNALKMSQDIATSRIQRDLIGAQIAGELADIKNTEQETQNKAQENIINQYNYNKYKGYNLPTGFQFNNPYSASQGAMFMLKDTQNAIKEMETIEDKVTKAIDKHNPGFKDKYNNVKNRLNRNNNNDSMWNNYSMP